MMRVWVLSYDITDDRRRAAMSRILEGAGERVQYSVFECRLRPTGLNRLLQELVPLLLDEGDSLRCYPLCRRCEPVAHRLGTAAPANAPPYVLV